MQNVIDLSEAREKRITRLPIAGGSGNRRALVVINLATRSRILLVRDLAPEGEPKEVA